MTEPGSTPPVPAPRLEEGPEGAAATGPPVGDLGYGEATDELDSIIAELDRGVVDVDLLETRLRRAVDIVEELDRRIRGARERVGALLPRLEAVAPDEQQWTEAASAGEDDR